jgi:hypothetical protein
MKTFTELGSKAADFCNVSVLDATKMATLNSLNNDSIRTMCNLHGGKLRFLEALKSIYTVANQEGYEIPNGFRKLIDLWIYSGDGTDSRQVIYTPEMLFDPVKFKKVKQAKYGTQNVPYFTYVEGRRLLIQPVPSTSGNMIMLRGRLNTKDLTIADYTTGTIVSIANNATTVTGSGTTWTKDMVGRYMQITETTADNGGDGYWYEIASVTSTTVLELKKPYEGLAIAAGSAAYKIGQVSAIPEAYDVAICYRTAALWWQNQNDLVRAKSYWMQYDGGNEAGYSSQYGGLVGQMIVNEGETEEGSYIPPFGSTNTSPQSVLYYYPYQQGSGF